MVEDHEAADRPDFAFLYASPLLDNYARPLPLIDHSSEHSNVFDALRQSHLGLTAVSEVATTRTLRRLLTQGVTMIHYCGHGLLTPLSDSFSSPPPSELETEPQGFSLVLEDDNGSSAHLFPASDLHALVAAGGHQLRLAFVSACHSSGGGQAFVRAGVPHVVAVKRMERIQDRAAHLFAEAFYFGLLRGGKTVRQAFDIGQSAVASAQIHDAVAEAAKFVLLPVSGDHDRPLAPDLLNAKRGLPFLDGSAAEPRSNLPAFFPLQFFGRHNEWHALLSNLTHRHKRSTQVLGVAGIGKSLLCVAAVHHLLQRRSFHAAVYAPVSDVRSAPELARTIATAIEEAVGIYRRMPFCETLSDAVDLLCDVLGGTRRPCLLVIDDAEPCLRSSAGRAAVRKLVARALGRIPLLRVLLCCQVPLAIHGVPQSELQLAPLKAADATRLFCAAAPRRLTLGEIFDGWPAAKALHHELEQVAQLLSLETDNVSIFARGGGAAIITASPEAASNHTNEPLRAAWVLPDESDSERVASLLHEDETLALTIYRRRGNEITLGLSQQRRLARSPVLRAAMGNPRALCTLAACVSPEGAATPLRRLERIVLETAGSELRGTVGHSSSSRRGSVDSRVAEALAPDDADADTVPPSPETTAAVGRALEAVAQLKRRFARDPSPPPIGRASTETSSWRDLLAASSVVLGQRQQRHALGACAAAMGALLVRRITSAFGSLPAPPPPPPASPAWTSILSMATSERAPAQTATASSFGAIDAALAIGCAAVFAWLLMTLTAEGRDAATKPIELSRASERWSSRPMELPLKRRSSAGSTPRERVSERASPRRNNAPASGLRLSGNGSSDGNGGNGGNGGNAGGPSGGATAAAASTPHPEPQSQQPQSQALPTGDSIPAIQPSAVTVTASQPGPAPASSSSSQQPLAAASEEPPSTLLQQLVAVFSFADAAEEDTLTFAERVLPLLKPRIAEAGDIIVNAGEEGGEMFFITSGLVEIVSSTGVNLYATKATGDFFGEATCLQCSVAGSNNNPRTRRVATVRAARRSQLWSLSSSDLLPLLKSFPRLQDAMMRTANERISQTCRMLAARLGTLLIDVIHDESRTAFFAELAPRMRPLACAAGEYVIRQGDTNDDLFFLCEGEVEVVRGGVEGQSEPETVLARRTPVSFFGEFAALQLGGARRSASVRCKERSLLWRVTAADLNSVLAQFPSIAETLQGVARARMQQNQANAPVHKRQSSRGERLVGSESALQPNLGDSLETLTHGSSSCSSTSGGDEAPESATATPTSDVMGADSVPPPPPPLRRVRSNEPTSTSTPATAEPQAEAFAHVGGLLASSRKLDAHFDEHMSLQHPTQVGTTLRQVTEARFRTQQTVDALQRQLQAEFVKLRMLQNVEGSLVHREPSDSDPRASGGGGSPHRSMHGYEDRVTTKVRVSQSLSALPRGSSIA